ncbi:MAG TPA: alpha/beta fold hydrolase [Candidatus Hydrogenedentes bacterium]|jgi:pimeloyl-ACP methyl ester carboxylesterase|nr:alpha/beta fold hydrolase [Candidatus Hydrogenedentota bacterium]
MNRRKKWYIAGIGGVLGIFLISGVLLAAAWYSLSGPEGEYFDSAGVRIHYIDEGQGVPVVLVHGFMNPAHLQWGRTGRIEALAKDYRVIALDNRGHGRSGKPHDPGQYGVQMAEDVVRLLDHLHIDKAHIIGYSMGGFITLKLAVLHPERLLSAAACGAGWLQPTEENREFGETVARAIETRTGFGPLLRRLGLPDRPMTFWEKAVLHLVFNFYHDPKALAAVSRASSQITLTEAELRANTVPVLTIIGGKDGLLPEAEALAAVMANHRLVVLEGKNHNNTDVSTEFLADLRHFLAAHTPAKPQ